MMVTKNRTSINAPRKLRAPRQRLSSMAAYPEAASTRSPSAAADPFDYDSGAGTVRAGLAVALAGAAADGADIFASAGRARKRLISGCHLLEAFGCLVPIRHDPSHPVAGAQRARRSTRHGAIRIRIPTDLY